MSKRAVVVIDIQNDYFPDGKYELVGIEQAAANAARVIETARGQGDRVIHVRHIFPSQDAPFFTPDSEGSEINPVVAPRAGEPVVVKNAPNPFLKTDLKKILDDGGIEEVVVVGYLVTRSRQLGVPPWTAVVLAALLRGVYHLYQGFGAGLGNVVMGLVFGAWYVRTGRVMPLVVAHVVIDLVAFIGYATVAPRGDWI